MKILISPLDWGLGHAARCIPLVKYLLEKNHEVIIGAEGRPLFLLKREFPEVEFIVMPGYGISYSEKGFMALKIALQIPRILAGIKKEHALLKKIIEQKKIEVVISDNRYGLWSNEVPCVFITHQLMVKSPFGERVLHELNKKYISRYTQCWIPDLPGDNNLSGDLSHKYPLPSHARFIGLLSRFSSVAEQKSFRRKLLVLLSGPEPQRSVFEKKILEQLSLLQGVISVLVVQGITEKDEARRMGENIEIVSHLTSDKLREEIISSEIVLSRPGYSTVMDLAVLGKKAIFVPTPGQTEQEYLAAYLSCRKIAFYASQKSFGIETALKESLSYSGFTKEYPYSGFKDALDKLTATLIK